MKAIQLVAPREFKRLEIADSPALKPNEALVRTHCVGVCGTDTSAYLGQVPAVQLSAHPRPRTRRRSARNRLSRTRMFAVAIAALSNRT